MVKVQQLMEEIETKGGLTPAKKVRETAERFPDLIAMTGIIILVLTGIYIAIRESKSEQIRARIQ